MNCLCEHLRAARLFLGAQAVIDGDQRTLRKFTACRNLSFIETKRCTARKQVDSSKVLIITADFAEIHSVSGRHHN